MPAACAAGLFINSVPHFIVESRNTIVLCAVLCFVCKNKKCNVTMLQCHVIEHCVMNLPAFEVYPLLPFPFDIQVNKWITKSIYFYFKLILVFRKYYKPNCL